MSHTSSVSKLVVSDSQTETALSQVLLRHKRFQKEYDQDIAEFKPKKYTNLDEQLVYCCSRFVDPNLLVSPNVAIRSTLKSQDTYLARVFAHSRDKYIAFREKDHQYFLFGKAIKSLVSVSSLLKLAFPDDFDKDKAYASMGYSHPLKHKPKEEVFAIWEQKNLTAVRQGTLLHDNIEQYYNSEYIINRFLSKISFPEKLSSLVLEYMDVKIKNTSKEYLMFKQFQKVWVEEHIEYDRDFPDPMRRKFAKGLRLEPYRTEMMLYVFNKNIMACGTADILWWYIDSSGAIKHILMDWKRSKKIQFRGYRNARGTGYIFQDIQNCNYEKYCLQLNLYRWFLTTVYGFDVTAMFLAVFHPNQTNYVVLDVPFQPDRVMEVLTRRQAQLRHQR